MHLYKKLLPKTQPPRTPVTPFKRARAPFKKKSWYEHDLVKFLLEFECEFKFLEELQNKNSQLIREKAWQSPHVM